MLHPVSCSQSHQYLATHAAANRELVSQRGVPSVNCTLLTFFGGVDGRPAMPGLRVGHMGGCKDDAPVLGLDWPVLQVP